VGVVLLWLAITLGVALGSALFPLISVELFLVGMVAGGHQPPIACWILGGVVAVGQVIGKLVYYYAARGTLRLPKLLTPKPRTHPRPPTWWTRLGSRIAAAFATLRAKCEKHPSVMIVTTSISSVVGLPPFAATTVLAGVVRMSLAAFVTTTLAGRFIRFTALAASPNLLHHVLPHFV
jgi:membrane protein YqaA with SNARE-associated domain